MTRYGTICSALMLMTVFKEEFDGSADIALLQFS
jgi:hypothetical protein